MPAGRSLAARSSTGKASPTAGSAAFNKAAFWVVPALVLAVATGAYWLSRPRIELSPDHFSTTLALYRVCNQRNIEGLQAVENKIQSMDLLADPTDPSNQAIASIIQSAKSNQWTSAMQRCRELLEDQVAY